MSAVILTGGKSRRMGQDKALLTLGSRSFLERILNQLGWAGTEMFTGVFLSTAEQGNYGEFNVPVVSDRIPGCGPLGGLYTARSLCPSPWLLALSCDMPLFHRALGEYLAAWTGPGIDAVVPSTGGHIHPLCGLYARSCTLPFLKQIEQGNFRLKDALKKLRTRYVPLEGTGYESLLSNINTPEEYRKVSQRKYFV
jgi:molybdopterin-guanine dinucleotide biosynthesis protein A